MDIHRSTCKIDIPLVSQNWFTTFLKDVLQSFLLCIFCMYCTYSVYSYSFCGILWKLLIFFFLLSLVNQFFKSCDLNVHNLYLLHSWMCPHWILSTRILNKLPSMFYADWMRFASFALRSIIFAWSVFTLNSNTNTFGNKKTFIFFIILCKNPSACITFYGCKLNDLKMLFFCQLSEGLKLL